MALASILPTFTLASSLHHGPVTDTIKAKESDSRNMPFTRLSLHKSKATVNTLLSLDE